MADKKERLLKKRKENTSSEEEIKVKKQTACNHRMKEITRYLIEEKQFINAGGYCRICPHFYPTCPNNDDVPESSFSFHSCARYYKEQERHLWTHHLEKVINISTMFNDLVTEFVHTTQNDLLIERIMNFV